MATAQNWVQQYEQSLANINIPPRTYSSIVAPPAAQKADAPAMLIPVASPSYAPITATPTGMTFSYGPMIFIGAFGVSLLATILGQGTVRTLGVLGMVGTVGAFLYGASQIH